MHTIKPIDEAAIKDASEKSKLIVSVEEHNVIGGLGSSISEQLVKFKNRSKMLIMGIDDKYLKGGSYTYLKNKYELSLDKIIEKIKINIG